MTTVLAEIFSSPDLYPDKLDCDARVLRFIRMTRDNYYQETFLDGLQDRDAIEINLDELLRYHIDHPAAAPPLRYVFHGAYCCSTLLARYFESIPECFVLKEPGFLTQLIKLVCDGAYHKTDSEWQDLLTVCIRLLGRTYPGQSLVLIKPSDLVTAIAEELLSLTGDVRGLFVTVEPRTFLLSVLKWDKRRRFVRRRLATLQSEICRGGLGGIDPEDLSDAETAVLLWAYYVSVWKKAQTRSTTRLQPLDGDRIADAPDEVLRDLAKFWQFPLGDDRLLKMLKHPSASLYSKDLSYTFTSDSRRNHLTGLAEMFGREADRAAAFIEQVEQILGFRCVWPV